MSELDDARLVKLTARLVGAYLQSQTLPRDGIDDLILQVHGSLSRLAAREKPVPQPAVPITQSIRPDYLVCLEDGQRFRTLKRHLAVAYGLTPEEYRAKWGLPANYPMVAPNYSRFRASVARSIGLGGKTTSG
jgi:predicted transcriptional regulator